MGRRGSPKSKRGSEGRASSKEKKLRRAVSDDNSKEYRGDDKVSKSLHKKEKRSRQRSESLEDREDRHKEKKKRYKSGRKRSLSRDRSDSDESGRSQSKEKRKRHSSGKKTRRSRGRSNSREHRRYSREERKKYSSEGRRDRSKERGSSSEDRRSRSREKGRKSSSSNKKRRRSRERSDSREGRSYPRDSRKKYSLERKRDSSSARDRSYSPYDRRSYSGERRRKSSSERKRRRSQERSDSREYDRRHSREERSRYSSERKRRKSRDRSDSREPRKRYSSQREERRSRKRSESRGPKRSRSREKRKKHSKREKSKRRRSKRSRSSSRSSWSSTSDSELEFAEKEDTSIKTSKVETTKPNIISKHTTVSGDSSLHMKEDIAVSKDSWLHTKEDTSISKHSSLHLKEDATVFKDYSFHAEEDVSKESSMRTKGGQTENRSKEKLPTESIDTSEPTTTSKKTSNIFAKKIEIKISSDTMQTKSNSGSKKSEEVNLIGKWEPVGKESLKAFTDLCKTLVEDERDKSKAAEDDVEEEKPKKPKVEPVSAPRHPFIVKPAGPLLHSAPIIPQNPAQAIQAGTIYQIIGNFPMQPTLPQTGDVTSNFPVSSGVQHRSKENVDLSAGQGNTAVFEDSAKKVNIGTVIAERLKAQQELRENPFSIQAKTKLKELDDEIKTWSKTGVKPEQFTGEKTKNILRKEDLEGGYMAWARKDFFSNLQPITHGKGMQLLQKMGWRQGQPLGKSRQGFINPIHFEVRTDRKGLTTAGEGTVSQKSRKKGHLLIDAQGKHPVSALAEFCTKKRWSPPEYKVIMDTGPAHNKKYLFSVVVNGTEFNPGNPCPTKKLAKAQAAQVAVNNVSVLS